MIRLRERLWQEGKSFQCTFKGTFPLLFKQGSTFYLALGLTNVLSERVFHYIDYCMTNVLCRVFYCFYYILQLCCNCNCNWVIHKELLTRQHKEKIPA